MKEFLCWIFGHRWFKTVVTYEGQAQSHRGEWHERICLRCQKNNAVFQGFPFRHEKAVVSKVYPGTTTAVSLDITTVSRLEWDRPWRRAEHLPYPEHWESPFSD